MRSIVVAFVTLTVLCTGQSVRSTTSDAFSVPGHTRIVTTPQLAQVRLKGKKLIVTGQDFLDGATIFIDNEAVATRNDSESPATRLIAKKGAKKIAFDSIAVFQVQNPGTDIGYSESLAYFRSQSLFSLILPMWSFHPLTIQVEDYVFVFGMQYATLWYAIPTDALVRVFDAQLPSDNYWAFQAVQPSFLRFYAERYGGGEAPPLTLYDTRIIIE